MKNKQVRPNRFLVTGALLWLLLALTGCIRPEAPTTPPAMSTPGATEEAPSTEGKAAVLEDSKWRLTLFGAPDAETPVVAGSTVTLEFSADGQAGGSAGCNTYGGSYAVQGDQLVFGEMVSTLMACVDQAVTEQEMAYLAALQSAGRFAVDGDMLRIWYDKEQGVLVFAAE
ncbi:MAG: META domain-containing protein [Caldilinea sp. CFX5]|nr:META domain-containing protein [Caldilinea sp. CFX5]